MTYEPIDGDKKIDDRRMDRKTNQLDVPIKNTFIHIKIIYPQIPFIQEINNYFHRNEIWLVYGKLASETEDGC